MLLAVGSTLIAAGVALLTFGQASSTSSLWVNPVGVRGANTQPSVVTRTVMPSSTAARQANVVTMRAAFGGDDKKKITREEEPDDYWISEAEKSGKSPWQDPMAWAGLSVIFVPLIILVIGFATGFIETQ
jgi:hypothetical protein